MLTDGRRNDKKGWYEQLPKNIRDTFYKCLLSTLVVWLSWLLDHSFAAQFSGLSSSIWLILSVVSLEHQYGQWVHHMSHSTNSNYILWSFSLDVEALQRSENMPVARWKSEYAKSRRLSGAQHQRTDPLVRSWTPLSHTNWNKISLLFCFFDMPTNLSTVLWCTLQLVIESC